MEDNKDIAEQNNTIITPTITNEEPDSDNKKIDLSSIIPQTSINEEGIEIESKEKLLKSDGSIILSDITNEIDQSISENFKYPEQIDIKRRKEERIRNRNAKKNININNKSPKNKNNLNIMSLVSLLTIVVLSFIGYYIYRTVFKDPFTLKYVTVELGDELPLNKDNYIKVTNGSKIDDLLYDLDTSQVDIDVVGTYDYYVTYKDIFKIGKIEVADTKKPSLTLREVIITEGSKYTIESFILSCEDLSGCNYSFANEEDSTYTDPGTYEVEIQAEDGYKNITKLMGKLTIEAKGMVKKLKKDNGFDFNKGYQETIEYELHFGEFNDDAIIKNGTKYTTRVYQSKDIYNKDAEAHKGEDGYNFDNDKLIISITEKANTIGNNYNTLKIVIEYLRQQGFEES